jgi:uncharacterized membrane-anchored protein
MARGPRGTSGPNIVLWVAIDMRAAGSLTTPWEAIVCGAAAGAAAGGTFVDATGLTFGTAVAAVASSVADAVTAIGPGPTALGA